MKLLLETWRFRFAVVAAALLVHLSPFAQSRAVGKDEPEKPGDLKDVFEDETKPEQSNEVVADVGEEAADETMQSVDEADAAKTSVAAAVGLRPGGDTWTAADVAAAKLNDNSVDEKDGAAGEPSAAVDASDQHTTQAPIAESQGEDTPPKEDETVADVPSPDKTQPQENDTPAANHVPPEQVEVAAETKPADGEAVELPVEDSAGDAAQSTSTSAASPTEADASGAIEADKPADTNKPAPVGKMPQDTNQVNYAGYPQAGDSHFLGWMISVGVVVAVVYLAFHNKQKILGLLVEGRTAGGARRSSNRRYRRSDKNFTDDDNEPLQGRHVIY